MVLLFSSNNILNSLKKYFSYSCLSNKLANLNSDTVVLNQIIEENGCWILLKCSGCGINHIPLVNKGKIQPINRYCKNCGSPRYYIEQKQNIDSYETMYALYSKDINCYKQGKIRHNFAQLTRKLMVNNNTQINIAENNKEFSIISNKES